LSRANLQNANMGNTNLSHATGLASPSKCLSENFVFGDNGIIVYKIFGLWRPPPQDWVIELGSVITEVVNSDRCTLCGSGINVGTFDLIKKLGIKEGLSYWKCLIPYKYLCDVVVPYNTEIQIRTGYLELIEEVKIKSHQNGGAE